MEQRKFAGDRESRQLAGNIEDRKVGGNTEERKMSGNVEQRKFGGDVTPVFCSIDPSCRGFIIRGIKAGAAVDVFDGRKYEKLIGTCYQ